ncbi:MAG: MBL fold metallo-hydrolase [Bradymonadia bacterium]
MQVKFWGVRGSIAVSGQGFGEVGGNTSCVEVISGEHRLILDGGTGLKALGDAHGRKPLAATVLFSHVHWDHIQGVPFFGPAFHPGSDLTLMGARRPTGGVREAVARQMKPPAWPVGPELLRGVKAYDDVPLDRTFDVGPFKVSAIDMHHPDGVVAYRVEADGHALVYATDVEHGGRIEPELVAFCAGADLIVHDAQYTQQEYTGDDGGPGRRGWGHSTWGEAVELGARAGAGAVALFHHDPSRDDEGVRTLEHLADDALVGCGARAFAAREGLQVSL